MCYNRQSKKGFDFSKPLSLLSGPTWAYFVILPQHRLLAQSFFAEAKKIPPAFAKGTCRLLAQSFFAEAKKIPPAFAKLRGPTWDYFVILPQHRLLAQSFFAEAKKIPPAFAKGIPSSWAHLGLLRHSSSAQASRPVRFSLKQKKSLPLSRKGFPLRGPTWARTRDHLIMSQVL
jgi:hypothetical protein